MLAADLADRGKDVKLKLNIFLTTEAMRAILVRSGRLFDVYALERHGGNEVLTFLLARDDPATDGSVRGFLAIIEYLSDEGPHRLTREMRKCWKENGTWICELIKNAWRISYFPFNENRILLATVFRKTKDKQKEEYRRAIGYYREFAANPRFIEEET